MLVVRVSVWVILFFLSHSDVTKIFFRSLYYVRESTNLEYHTNVLKCTVHLGLYLRQPWYVLRSVVVRRKSIEEVVKLVQANGQLAGCSCGPG